MGIPESCADYQLVTAAVPQSMGWQVRIMEPPAHQTQPRRLGPPTCSCFQRERRLPPKQCESRKEPLFARLGELCEEGEQTPGGPPPPRVSLFASRLFRIGGCPFRIWRMSKRALRSHSSLLSRRGGRSSGTGGRIWCLATPGDPTVADDLPGAIAKQCELRTSVS
jgi:hypothetical protein